MIILVCVEPAGVSAATRAALELACSSGPSARVVVASVGSSQQFRKGPPLVPPGSIDRILRVQDSALGDASSDTTALLLAELARYAKATVVLAGEHSGNDGQGLVAAGIANHLEAPYMAGAHAVAATPTEGRVQVTVRAGGVACKVVAPTPVVAAVPPLGGIAEAPTTDVKLPKVEILSLSDLGVDASRLVRRPDLRGSLVSTPAQVVRNTSFGEAVRVLLRR